MNNILRLLPNRCVKLGQLRNFVSVNKNNVANEGSSQADSSSSDSSSDDERSNENEIKQKLLKATLQFVPEYGWNREALAAGAKSIGLSPAASGLCRDGGVEIAHYFYRHCNSELVKYMKTQVTQTADGKIQRSVPIPKFIENALETRLRMIIPFHDEWPQAMMLMSRPLQAPTSIGNLQTLVDDIWHYAGDTSADFNWYTKRLMLAGVYKSTEICFLQDRSEDFEETWAFLRRRLADTAKIQQFKQGTSGALDFLSAAAMTAQSMLGLRSIK